MCAGDIKPKRLRPNSGNRLLRNHQFSHRRKKESHFTLTGTSEGKSRNVQTPGNLLSGSISKMGWGEETFTHTSLRAPLQNDF